MSRQPKRWGIGMGLMILLLLQGLSCERELSDSSEPFQSAKEYFLQDGTWNVDIRNALYVGLDGEIDPATVTTQTVHLFPMLFNQNGVARRGDDVPLEIPTPNYQTDINLTILTVNPLCDLYPDSHYILEVKGLVWADGRPVPEMQIRFFTGPIPGDLPDPLYQDELTYPLMAYDLADFYGINSGLVDDPIWNTVAGIVAVGISNVYKRVNDPNYFFGHAEFGTYISSDNFLFEPPYKAMVLVSNFSFDDLDLGLTPGWFNLRPYWPTMLVDSMENVDAWTSSDPANTPVALLLEEKYYEGSGGMRIGVNGLESLGDAVSRPWSDGFPEDATGIMFAVKAGPVTSGDFSSTRLELRLTDRAGNVVGTNLDILGLNQNWIFFTRMLPGDSLPGDFYEITTVSKFEPTQVAEIALVQVDNFINDLVGDLFVDYLTVGEIKDVTVYLPPVVITPFETLPLYVDEFGSTYWAYNSNGVHTLNLANMGCYNNCPVLSPDLGLVKDNLARVAP